MNERYLACLVLADIVNQKHTFTQAFDQLKKQYPLSDVQRRLVYALSAGVLRYYPRLHYIAHLFLEKPLKEKDSDILLLILLGLYQLSHMRIPAHAAISETVETARLLKKNWAVGLINALLRRYQREEKECLKKIGQNLSARTAHPQWLIDLLQEHYPSSWQTILETNNTEPPLALRVNIRHTSQAEYLNILHKEAIDASIIPYTDTGIIAKEIQDVTQLPGFSKGWFSVQDGGAQFAPRLLELSDSQHVLDACAAPGGKTAHLLEQDIQNLQVTALERSSKRIEHIKTNLRRLDLHANVIRGDALRPNTWWDKKPFDRILLDAPCSATGIIRRHPDIKILKNTIDLTRLAEQQLALLQALWPLLKPNGILLYVTCSIMPIENSDMMSHFLKQQKDATTLPFHLPIGIPQTIGHQLIPGEYGMDGFYYARLLKL